MQFFIGKGYSEEFTRHMYETLDLPLDTPISITDTLDHLCLKCPNHSLGLCISQSKVERIDQAVLNLCNFHTGDRLTIAEFRDRAKEKILATNRLKEVCGDCEFYSICEEQLPLQKKP